ncbi:adenylosuccinate lyase [bacterium]|nr:adenylosuccinate lyase [bacterium]
MIERYSREPMAGLWTEQARYECWWKVELAALSVRVDRGEVPADALAKIQAAAAFTPEEINEVEAEVHHDIIAFLTVIADHVGPESRFIHMGLTSSDIVDTAFALQIKEAAKLILDNIFALRMILRRRALEFKNTPSVGRTHGIHAEPTVFGLKFAQWEDEFARHETRLHECMERVLVGKLSGAVGNYGHTDPEMEEAVMEHLGLGVSAVSTQVVSRDRHAEFLNVLALIGSTIEKIAVEIRHLQRTEVGEAYEPFGKNQKGSSAMPHKRNPILCERLSGMARLIRGYAVTAQENIALWHERDISHSSAERIIFPDACIALDYMMHILIKVLDGLDVRPQRMKDNLYLTHGVLASEKVLHALIGKGWTREAAYSTVQACAKAALADSTPFVDVLLKDKNIAALFTRETLEALVLLEPRYEFIDKIFKRLSIIE